jgi:hypothetical protein
MQKQDATIAKSKSNSHPKSKLLIGPKRAVVQTKFTITKELAVWQLGSGQERRWRFASGSQRIQRCLGLHQFRRRLAFPFGVFLLDQLVCFVNDLAESLGIPFADGPLAQLSPPLLVLIRHVYLD